MKGASRIFLSPAAPQDRQWMWSLVTARPPRRFERAIGLANGRAGLLPSPALCERRHRCLAGRLYPCAARRMWPLWPLAHIQWRSYGAIGTLKMRPTMTSFSMTS
jgi:hypothetical protein